MRTILTIITFLLGFMGIAQNEVDIIDAYEDFVELPREQIYTHLNKSTYIKGEMLAFNSYVFLASSKSLSNNTTNAYCQILDSNDKVIKEKLLLVNEGISNNNFMIDSLFTSSDYKFKVYTNWQRNFKNEHNYYLEHFKVIDPEREDGKEISDKSDELDIQLLPESGHFLSDIENVIGVIVKDTRGIGISNLKLDLVEAGNTQNVLQTVTLNQFGIGKFILKPKANITYRLKYNFKDKLEQNFEIPKAEPRGIIISLKDIVSKKSIVLTIKTNSNTMNQIKPEGYKLLIHNGDYIEEVLISFEGKNEVSLPISYSNLFKGVNIFTLFNSEDEPLAERMYFNFEGIDTILTEKPITNSKNDSIEIKIPIPNVNQSQFQNLSISVLPSTTKSYNHHQNIISTIYLQPYVQSRVEQGDYYFTDITDKKKYELDVLLLTQGWSSYKWYDIFNNPPNRSYDFEQGISYTITNGTQDLKNLFVYPNHNSKSESLSLEGNKSIEVKGLIPLENEILRLGEIQANNELGKTNVKVRFKPVSIDDFYSKYVPLSSEVKNYSPGFYKDFIYKEDTEKLEEVTVNARIKNVRLEKLDNSHFGDVTLFGELEHRMYRTFAQFINGRGFVVEESSKVVVEENDSWNGHYSGPSLFRISISVPTTINASVVPIIYLDGTLLGDHDILNNFSMDLVDYVEVNKAGLGEGVKGGAGVIRIYTDATKRMTQRERVTSTQYKIPLTYSRVKNFYVPKYSAFNTGFYEDYGVIDWFPNTKVDSTGNISLRILKTNTPVKLYIEGVINNDELISEEIRIED